VLLASLLAVLALSTPSRAATGTPTMTVSAMYRNHPGTLIASGLDPATTYTLASSSDYVRFTKTSVTPDSTGRMSQQVSLDLNVPLSVTSVDVTLTPVGATTPVLTTSAVARAPEFEFLSGRAVCPGDLTLVGLLGFPTGKYDFSGSGITFSPSQDTVNASGVPSRMTARIAPDASGPLTATATVAGSDAPLASLIGTSVAAPYFSSTYQNAQYDTLTGNCFHPNTSATVSASGPGVVTAAATVDQDGTVSAPLTLIPYTYARTVTITVRDADAGVGSAPVQIPSTTLRSGQTVADTGGTTAGLLSPHRGYFLQTTYCALELQQFSESNGQLRDPLLWESNALTTGGTCRLALLNDGNLVLYNHANHAIWQAGSQATGSANTLVMQDDGNLIERTSAGATVWSTKYGRRVLASGTQLTQGQGLRFTTTALLLETNGNLVLFHGGHAVWESHTAGRGAIRLLMQRDGNLVLYNAAGHSVWRSNTTAASAYLVVNNGFLALQTPAKKVVWQSG
jgi:hypothetical protein